MFLNSFKFERASLCSEFGHWEVTDLEAVVLCLKGNVCSSGWMQRCALEFFGNDKIEQASKTSSWDLMLRSFLEGRAQGGVRMDAQDLSKWHLVLNSHLTGLSLSILLKFSFTKF